MSVFNAILIGLAMGAVFGIALEKSRVFEPGIIVGQMQLKNFIMLKMFLAAVVTGLLVLAALQLLGLTKLHPKATLFGADLLGGALLGVGIALAGACPGTILAQIGAGYRDAWLTLLGGLAGAVTFIVLEPSLKPLLLTGGPGKITLDSITGLPFWAVAGILAFALAVGLVFLEKWQPWRTDLGQDYTGVPER